MLNELIKQLLLLPKHWPLAPVGSNKNPLGVRWNERTFLPIEAAEKLIASGRLTVLGKYGEMATLPKGFGLVTGLNSEEFLIALDADGAPAMAAIERCGIPPTVSFTSGRPHRAQFLFKAPRNAAPFVRSRRPTAGPFKGLEFRGSKLMSVLPPSPHPISGQYVWIAGPTQCEVAPAPQWILAQMQQPQTADSPASDRTFIARNAAASDLIQKRNATDCDRIPKQLNMTAVNCPKLSEIKLLMEVIHPKFASDYHSWLFAGMALKYTSPLLLPDWDEWSRQSSKYKPGECQAKWASFKGCGITFRYLYWLANLSAC
ncbi:MAG: bifunctional DNA primase/polymerase [Oscillatoriaceae cyanobacterium Prado104]|nr:bifunctional DNA primase/polymerase [Oscillatoriaceae cyanobacterium Prado104]